MFPPQIVATNIKESLGTCLRNSGDNLCPTPFSGQESMSKWKAGTNNLLTLKIILWPSIWFYEAAWEVLRHLPRVLISWRRDLEYDHSSLISQELRSLKKNILALLASQAEFTNYLPHSLSLSTHSLTVNLPLLLQDSQILKITKWFTLRLCPPLGLVSHHFHKGYHTNGD